MIPAADWPAVSLVHRVPIPADVKALLEAVMGGRGVPASGGSRSSPPSQHATLSRKTAPIVPTTTVPNRSEPSTPKVNGSPVPSPTRNRGGGSPPQSVASLSSTTSRNSGSDDGSPSTANTSDYSNSPRRPALETQADRRRDSSREPRHSPGRKPAELAGSLSRKGSASRPPVPPAAASILVGKTHQDSSPQTRRASTTSISTSAPSSAVATRTSERDRADRDKDRDKEKERTTITIPPPRRQRPSIGEAFATMSISGESSASSSDSGGSETTIISDGGFTDYLSDESEAELQRQAELKAALIAQSHQEEQEFRAARQQLASIDLRPPKSWTSHTSSSARNQ